MAGIGLNTAAFLCRRHKHGDPPITPEASVPANSSDGAYRATFATSLRPPSSQWLLKHFVEALGSINGSTVVKKSSTTRT
jgi:hypothetical protein